MNAIVIAGTARADEESLDPYTQGRPKALIDLGGKPMGQWVLDALDGAPSVERVGLVGLPPGHGLDCQKPMTTIANQGTLLRNVLAGLAWTCGVAPADEYALLTSADIPALQPEMVEWRIETGLAATPFDLDYIVVEQKTMELRFPAASRSYVHLRDVTVCGGDINLIRAEMIVRRRLWERIAATRKSPLRQAALIGPDTLVLLLLRRLTLEQVRKRVARRLSIQGRVHLSPYAEMAMDVDKPGQLEILRQELSVRAGREG